MPNIPPPPHTPNFTPGAGGRLATDRYDFESHVEGTGFRHKADQIDLFPTVVISSTTATNVEQAIQLLAANLSAPQVPQATQGSALANLGIVTLGGDFQGTGSTALSPKVSGIQGRPIQNAAPTIGQSLAWNGSFWTPTSVQPTGAASGDLSGTYPSPTVAKLQGSAVSAAAPALNNVLEWNGASWAPTALPSSLPPSGAASGDLSGTYPSPAVAKLQGTSVSAVAPTGGQVLTYNGSVWIPAASSASGRAYFGTGVDSSALFDLAGSAVPPGTTYAPGGTYTLNRNIACTSIQINAGVVVYTQGFVIMCTGTLTNNGIIDNSGTNASGTNAGNGAFWTSMGGGSNGGSGLHASSAQKGADFLYFTWTVTKPDGTGANSINYNVGLGGQGGTGGNPANLAGGLDNPGPPTLPAVFNAGDLTLSNWLSSGLQTSSGTGSPPIEIVFGGGTGGGGGASPLGGPAIDGGGGGGGGGVLLVCANTLAGNGIIQANGGNGANTAGYAGGGGGGGGVVIVIYNSKTSWTGNLSATGGIQGAGPSGAGLPGAPGTMLYVQG